MEDEEEWKTKRNGRRRGKGRRGDMENNEIEVKWIKRD